MKISMAESDSFNIGMTISCVTCHGQKIQGEVVAFDFDSKLMSLKCPAASGKPQLHDIRLVNLSYVKDLCVISEASEAPATLPYLNLHKLATRVRTNAEEKIRQVNYKGVGVTPQAQKLFLVITKTINEVKWDGQNIVILDSVTINPPYAIENCKGKEGDNTLTHVRKIVEKYYRDQESRESPASSTSSSSS